LTALLVVFSLHAKCLVDLIITTLSFYPSRFSSDFFDLGRPRLYPVQSICFQLHKSYLRRFEPVPEPTQRRIPSMAETLSGSTSRALRPSSRDNFSKPLRREESLACKDTRRVYDDIVLGGVFAGKTQWAHSDSARPSTAGGAMYTTSAFGEYHGVKVHTPKSPAIMFAAEVRTNRPLPPPRSPGKAITTEYVDPNSTSWPLHSTSPITYKSESGHLDISADLGDRSKPRLSRWKSFRGLFGMKRPEDQASSSSHAPFDSSRRAQQYLTPTPYRSATTSRVTTRGKWGESHVPTQRQDAVFLSVSGQPIYTYTPTRGKPPGENALIRSDHDKNEGFQGGFRYQRGTTTAATPTIDVEIPHVQLERYSVMFDGLVRATTEPSLLSRRQSIAKRPPTVRPEALRTPSLPYLDTKPCPPTPRSAAKYQLSLFPAPSPHQGQLNPLGMHKPRTLQRSHTSPTPRSPSTFVHKHESSAVSILSEEVPVRLEIAPEDTAHPPSSCSPVSHIPQSTRQASGAGAAKSSPLTGMPGFLTGSMSDDRRVDGSWISTVEETEWEATTDISPHAVRSSQPSEGLAIFARTSDEAAVEQPSPQIAVARQMSLTRGKSVKRDLDKEKLLTPTLVEKKPMTPLLVQLGHRAKQKSHTVQIEGI
jgi:hypothetical protein